MHRAASSHACGPEASDPEHVTEQLGGPRSPGGARTSASSAEEASQESRRRVLVCSSMKSWCSSMKSWSMKSWCCLSTAVSSRAHPSSDTAGAVLFSTAGRSWAWRSCMHTRLACSLLMCKSSIKSRSDIPASCAPGTWTRHTHSTCDLARRRQQQEGQDQPLGGPSLRQQCRAPLDQCQVLVATGPLPATPWLRPALPPRQPVCLAAHHHLAGCYFALSGARNLAQSASEWQDACISCV